MKHEPLNLADYEIGEEQLANLASEFYGTVLYPAGNHQLAHLSFAGADDDQRAHLRADFLSALQSYRRNQP